MCWIAIAKRTWTVVTLPPAAAVLAVLMIAGCGSASMAGNRPTGAVPGSPVPSSAIPRLKVMAYRTAKVNGDADPSWISAVVTTYKQALTSATPGDIIPGAGSAPVYLLTMKGHFRSPMGPVPRSGHRPHPPAARYLSQVIQAKTFQATDLGLGPKPPPVDPASLGPVTWLKP
jgi:hypothetical protein